MLLQISGPISTAAFLLEPMDFYRELRKKKEDAHAFPDFVPDQLTPLECMELFDEGKKIDRIPCCLDTGETMAPMLGIPIDEYYHSSEKMCQLEE